MTVTLPRQYCLASSWNSDLSSSYFGCNCWGDRYDSCRCASHYSVVVVLTLIATRLKPLILLVFFIHPRLYHDLKRFDIFEASPAKILEHPVVIETILEAIYVVTLCDVHDCGLLVKKRRR